MIAYWLYKFEVEDKDVGVVDYVKIEDSLEWEKLDIKLPVVSVCILQPFLETRLMELKPPIDPIAYHLYLDGSETVDCPFDANLTYVDYSHVTLRLFDYWEDGFSIMRQILPDMYGEIK